MEEMWLARDKNGLLWMYIGDSKPEKKGEQWCSGKDKCVLLGYHVLQEVQWSDEEPTRLGILIDK